MKRLLVTLGVMTLVLLPTAAFAASANIPNLSSGAIVTNTVTVRCQGSGNSGIAKVELFINGSSVAKHSPGGIEQNAETSYNWTTNGLRNGGYTLRCSATENSGSADSQTINVTVDNAPSSPSGVNASASGNQVNVSWNANPEPDITGYRLERDSGGGFGEIATVGGTSYTDSPGPGNHSYRVIAIRNSSVSGGKASSPSGSSSAYIEPPPDPGPGETPGSGHTPGESGTPGGGGGAGGGSGSGGGTSNGGTFGKLIQGGSGSGDAFVVKGKRVAQAGLPTFSSLSLPGVQRPPSLARATADFDWGTFDEELPYSVDPETGQPKVLDEQFGSNIAARSPARIIPPDGLRWVAIGILFVVTALLLRVLAARLATDEEDAANAALGEVKPEPQSA